MPRKPHTFSQINLLRERYKKSVQGKESLIQVLNEVEISEHVYNSNAIENSTLSLDETEKILLQIDLDRFVNEREIFEAKNLARVVSYIEIKSQEATLSLDVILLLHKMLIGNIQDDIAGRFRNIKEWVRVGSHMGADPKEVEGLLQKMLLEYTASKTNSIIPRIALLHLTFESIHPFVDGNGRIGRVVNNYQLLQEGHVPINITFVNRTQYYNAFKAFDEKNDTTLMEEIIGRALANSYHKRLAYLEGKKIITLNDYAKKNKLSHSNVINKAQRQTIEAFYEKGVWKIGV